MICALLVAAPGRAVAQSALDELLATAAAASAASQHEEAYALLSAQEDAHIGEIRFDYALGRAALNAGRPASATIAFSRVLALDPGHAGARIDMGRAYLALGNRAQAEVAFEALLALDPPPALRVQLLAYLAQARAERRETRALVRGFLSVSAGTSSNVNQSPSQSQVFVPLFADRLQLADQNVRKADDFGAVGGGIDAVWPLAGRYSLIAGGEFLSRANAHESAFDVGGVAGSIGLARVGDRHVARAQLQAVRSTLGGKTSRDLQAVSADVTESAATLGSFGAFFGFVQAGTFRHPSTELQIFDADFLSIGAGTNIALGRQSTGTLALFMGEDRDRGGNPGGDRTGVGLRLAYERAFSPKVRMGAVLGVQDSDYDRFDPAFLVFRKDRRLDLEVTAKYEISAGLEARIGMLRSVQDSNIAIYEFRRTDWTVTLRYRFD